MLFRIVGIACIVGASALWHLPPVESGDLIRMRFYWGRLCGIIAGLLGVGLILR